MNTEVLKVREENKDLRTVIQQLQESHNKNKIQWENEIDELRQDNINKNNKKQKLERHVFIMNSEIQKLREESITIQNEMQKLFREKANMNGEMQRVQEENNDLRIEIEQREQNDMFSYFERGGSVVVSMQELGRGAYGKVFIGDFYGTKVAVKEYHEIILSPHNQQLLCREIGIALQCRHPNLLQFICATENDKHNLLIVTELMDTSLRTFLEQRAWQRSQLGYHEIKLISLDVARGLSYLHSKTPCPVIHRDISSANVLLWIENGAVKRAKISDYGSANFMQACNTANPGAAIYAAPEANRAQHDPKVTNQILIDLLLENVCDRVYTFSYFNIRIC